MKQNFEENIKHAISTADSGREPLPGNEERFEMRLLKLKEERKVRAIPSWIWLAAAFGFYLV